MTNKYHVDGTSTNRAKEGGREYAIWRVIITETGQLICAFYGGASNLAAREFCDRINNDPKWNED